MLADYDFVLVQYAFLSKGPGARISKEKGGREKLGKYWSSAFVKRLWRREKERERERLVN